jgi:quinone-modifying oxidoreductase subunit QmoB
MATGWKPYDANRLTEFTYGTNPDVITSIELEQMVNGSAILKPSDNKPVHRVLFIQCAGSRDEKHLPYCSTYCCGTSLKQAMYFRQSNPESQVFIIYKDVRAFGIIEHFYKEVQRDQNIFMTKGEISNVSSGEKEVLVEVKDSLLDDQFQLKVDMVVLATGMVPNDTEALNLNYRLGKGLPGLKYDFPDSHFICFPYETRRTGIYSAGNLRNPGFISMCIDDARGAAMKAIQCAELTKQGKAVHPRSGDKSFPDLYMPRCTECKRCTEECPFGAYDETEKGTPLPNINRCRRCAICLGACPERIINFQDFSIESVSSMIKSVEFPEESPDEIRILAFVCENDAYPAFDMAGLQRLTYSDSLRIIPVRCIGSLNRVWISDALAEGFDGILIVGCKPGEDYQCHYMQGSELTETRSENIRETLETMMLEKERVRTEFLEINDYHRIPEIIDGYVNEIKKIGPNPFKGI